MTQNTVAVDTGSLENLQKVVGVFDENLVMIARELNVTPRVEGTNIILEGEEGSAAVGGQVLQSLLAIGEAGEQIDKSRLLYCIGLAREGRAEDIRGIMKDVVAVTSRGKPVKCKTVGQREYVSAIKKIRSRSAWDLPARAKLILRYVLPQLLIRVNRSRKSFSRDLPWRQGRNSVFCRAICKQK